MISVNLTTISYPSDEREKNAEVGTENATSYDWGILKMSEESRLRKAPPESKEWTEDVSSSRVFILSDFFRSKRAEKLFSS